MLYLESKFASLISYGLSVQLLQEVLPIGNTLNAATIRNHTQTVAQRIDAELGDGQLFFIDGCEWDGEGLPRPDMPLNQKVMEVGRRLEGASSWLIRLPVESRHLTQRTSQVEGGNLVLFPISAVRSAYGGAGLGCSE